VSRHLVGWVTAAADNDDAFSDLALLQAMLRFESALAQAQAELGLIPKPAAAAIGQHALTFSPDPAPLALAGADAGSLAIPYVQALTRHVAAHDEHAAGYVHHGATSQDLLDSALALCAQTSIARLQAHLLNACNAAQSLARTHALVPMLARTLLQPAGITTVGFKCAQWAQALARTRRRVLDTAGSALAVSLGGAIGNLAAHGDAGADLRAALAAKLGLVDPGFTWHSGRDTWIALATDVALAAGSLRKIAADIALLAQAEVGEASEPAAVARGGSTAMPHKRNPVLCMRVLAATQPVPGLTANLLAAMPHEHERALGNWQAETSQYPAVLTQATTAASAMAELLAGLNIDLARCRGNIAACRGSVFSEVLAALFLPGLGKREAQALVSDLARRVQHNAQKSLLDLAIETARTDPRLSGLTVQAVEAVFDVDRVAQASAQQVEPMLSALAALVA
jgi:3-carboxy-cis,cis-muconate cycloisomerase